MFDLSKKLKELRKAAGLTQAQVALQLNVSFQAVSLWERGETAPDIDKLTELAKLYGTDCNFFAGPGRPR